MPGKKTTRVRKPAVPVTKADLTVAMDRVLKVTKTDRAVAMDRVLKVTKTDLAVAMDRVLKVTKADLTAAIDQVLGVVKDTRVHLEEKIQDTRNHLEEKISWARQDAKEQLESVATGLNTKIDLKIAEVQQTLRTHSGKLERMETGLQATQTATLELNRDIKAVKNTLTEHGTILTDHGQKLDRVIETVERHDRDIAALKDARLAS